MTYIEYAAKRFVELYFHEAGVSANFTDTDAKNLMYSMILNLLSDPKMLGVMITKGHDELPKKEIDKFFKTE